MNNPGIITEQGDLGLGFTEIDQEDIKVMKEKNEQQKKNTNENEKTTSNK